MNAVAAVGAVGLAVTVGVYVIAVIDRMILVVVAGQPVGGSDVLAGPLRRAAGLLAQSRTTTERPDAAAWVSATALLAAAAATALAAIPLARGMAVADIPDGLVLYGAAVSTVLVAVFLHGWSPNALFPLLGAYRFAAQGLSYPIPLLLVLLGAGLRAESLAVGGIVESQAELWNVVVQPLGLPLLLVTGLGLAFWGPLNLPDASDLGGGTSAEVGGSALLVWQAARAAVLLGVAAMGAAAFLGGWHGPWLPGAVWMMAKTLALVVALLWAGHAVARIPIERFVVFAWVVLIPLALLDVFVSGALAL